MIMIPWRARAKSWQYLQKQKIKQSDIEDHDVYILVKSIKYYCTYLNIITN